MKIGIDCRLMGKGYGVGRYLEQLVLQLLTNYEQIRTYELRTNKVEYVLFVRSPDQLSSNLLSAVSCQPSAVVVADIPWYSWQEQTKLTKIIKQAKVDLLHFPHWNVPLFYNDPFVLTLHDLTMFHYPRPEATTLGPVKFWLKDQAHRLVIRHAVKRAQQILVMSEWVKQDAHATLGVPLEKMTVTYQAPFIRPQIIPPMVGEVGGGVSTLADGDPLLASPYKGEDYKVVLSSYGVTKPFIIYVGAAYPHKNLAGLIKAWKIFVNKYSDDYQLVLVGREDYFYRRLKDYISHFSFLISPTCTDFVPDEDLEILYKQASLFVFPSLAEGFGLPPLEAMARGVPVVSSNRSCLPEVLGEAALYFDPENYEQMAEAMHQGLTDEEMRFELRGKAREELLRYSGEKLARKTVDIYEKKLET